MKYFDFFKHFESRRTIYSYFNFGLKTKFALPTP